VWDTGLGFTYPLPQAVQVRAPLGIPVAEPAKHSMQAWFMAVGAYCPTGQLSHECAATFTKVPPGQTSQVARSVELNLPSLQASHSQLPVLGATLPGAQTSHEAGKRCVGSVVLAKRLNRPTPQSAQTPSLVRYLGVRGTSAAQPLERLGAHAHIWNNISVLLFKAVVPWTLQALAVASASS